MTRCHQEKQVLKVIWMTKTNYVPTDFRILELKYKKALYNTVFMQLTQLEILKIRKALLTTKNIELALKIEKFIGEVDRETNKHTDYERKLPYKTNGARVKQWGDFKDIQTVD